MPLACPYCGSDVEVKDRNELWPRTKIDGRVYICSSYPSCDAYVGACPKTGLPLGTLADPPLRRLRKQAHRALDWTWKTGRMTRTEAYRLLCREMGLSKREGHIACMDEEQCRRVIAIFNEKRPWKVPNL